MLSEGVKPEPWIVTWVPIGPELGTIATSRGGCADAWVVAMAAIITTAAKPSPIEHFVTTRKWGFPVGCRGTDVLRAPTIVLPETLLSGLSDFDHFDFHPLDIIPPAQP